VLNIHAGMDSKFLVKREAVRNNSQLTLHRSFEDLPINYAYLLGRKITCITSNLLIESIHKACANRKKIIVANYNIHSFNMSVQYSWFYEFLKNADIAHCDGYQIPEDYRVSYSILMPKLLERCNESRLSVYLLGAKNQNMQMALENVSQMYPSIRISGHHGYFPLNNPIINQKIVSKINQFKPNILIVGMGMPIQEYWVQQYQEQLEVNAILLGGAAIDRLAGVVPECPKVLSKNGLEWLYRLVKEPKRLMTRYALGNPAFLLQVVLAKSMNDSVNGSVESPD
jgi:N-acetylglucosaminyldiphosphoundecaprenol N-acetyl-beta-D-mannosaminyltransferase